MTEITIRRSRPDDAQALSRLAALDSCALPAGDTLVAHEGGELRAALSLDSGDVIADPFHRTAELVAMLEVRARQLRVEPRSKRRVRRLLQTAPRSV